MESLVATARLHAPLLIVSAPFLGGALAIAVGRPFISWLAATLAALAAAALAIDLFARGLSASGPLATPREAIAIGLDPLGVFSIALITLGATAALSSALAFFSDLERQAIPFAIALMAFAGAAWSGTALAQDFATLYLFAEIAWLSSVGLVALSAGRDRGAINGALRMLSEGGVASAFFLIGVGLTERGLGGGSIASLASAHIVAPNTCTIGVALIFVALIWKAGLAPFNAWSSAAFGRGGGLATILLGGAGSAGVLLALAHAAAAALAAPTIGLGLGLALSALGVVSAAIASIQAIGATSIWRLAAYAMAAQMGCALLGIALGSPAGLEAGLIQIVASSASTLALLCGALLGGVGASLSSLDGLGRRAPIAGVVITIGALSMMGAPLTLAFLGRWRLIEAALSPGIGWWWAAGAAIAVSLAGSYYGGRLIERIYFRHASQSKPSRAGVSGPKIALAPALIAAVFAILSAVDPSLLLRAAHIASQTIVDRGQ